MAPWTADAELEGTAEAEALGQEAGQSQWSSSSDSAGPGGSSCGEMFRAETRRERGGLNTLETGLVCPCSYIPQPPW